MESTFKDCREFRKQGCVTWILVGKHLNIPMDIIYLIGKRVLQQDYLDWIGAKKRHEEQMKEKLLRLFPVKFTPKKIEYIFPISRIEKNMRNRQIKQQMKMKSKR
jgi:hypothetical protein